MRHSHHNGIHYQEPFGAESGGGVQWVVHTYSLGESECTCNQVALYFLYDLQIIKNPYLEKQFNYWLCLILSCINITFI